LIFGNQVVHPPAIYLIDEFARHGPSVIPLLRSKLQAIDSELTLRDIVSVCDRMNQLGTYDVGRDRRLMHLLEDRVAAMRGPWKPLTQGMVNKLRK
jgi:hypothetical protein